MPNKSSAMPLSHPNPSRKRNRDENWSDGEKRTLLALVKSAIHIIEDKSTETNTNKKKNHAWKEIAEKFHMMTGKNRPANKILDQWKRMKGHAKKNVSAFEKSRRSTGGGQNNVRVSDLDWAVKELVPQIFFHDTNRYDDDGYENLSMDVTQSPSLLRDFEGSEAQLQLTNMDVTPMMPQRNTDTCTTFAGSQPSQSLHQHIEPSVIVQEFDVIQTDPCNSPIIPFRELAETPRPTIQLSPVPTREINFDLRNECEAVEDELPPRDVSARRTRIQRKRKFNEGEYHKMLIKRKEEEYDNKAKIHKIEIKQKEEESKKRDEIHLLELKQREEVHELELKKRKMELEILELTKLKLERELHINIV